MAVNNVSLAMSASSYGAYQQKLTAATKAELDKLGITYDSNITEQEGKALIAQYKSQEARNKSSDSNFTKEHDKHSNDLFEKALELAKKLGIDCDKNTNFNALLAKIEQTLESKINSSQNNENLLNKLKEYSEELSSIQAESIGSTFNSSNKALEMSLEMLSLYNQNLIYN